MDVVVHNHGLQILSIVRFSEKASGCLLEAGRRRIGEICFAPANHNIDISSFAAWPPLVLVQVGR